MSPFASVRAIAFDMDETLIDFSASRRAGIEAALTTVERAGAAVDREVFLERHAALAREEDAAYLARGSWRPTQERFSILCAEFGLPSDGFARALTEAYTEARYGNLRQYPETDATLRALKARFPLYLVTNGPSSHQRREIEVTGVAPYFERLFVCEEFGLRKPDPRIFELIRAEAGVSPHEMLVVGDNPDADIDAPRRLGWRTVWVKRGGAGRGSADTARADAVVRSVAEVPALLGL